MDSIEKFLPHRGDIALLHWRGHVRIVQSCWHIHPVTMSLVAKIDAAAAAMVQEIHAAVGDPPNLYPRLREIRQQVEFF